MNPEIEEQSRKIVLLVRGCESTNIVYNYLVKHKKIHCVIAEQPIPDTEMFRKRVKRQGFFISVSQVGLILFIHPLLRLISKKRKKQIINEYKLNPAPIPEEKITRVKSVNSDECRKLLSSINPDVIIVNGTRIISQKTLSSVAAPFINIHDGITPLYRGVHGGYWAMVEKKPELFGTTIHFVDKGVDTGGIIEQVFTIPDKKDNLYTYPYLQHAICLPSLLIIINKILSGEEVNTKQSVVQESKLRYHPTIYRWLISMRRTW